MESRFHSAHGVIIWTLQAATGLVAREGRGVTWELEQSMNRHCEGKRVCQWDTYHF